MDYQQEPKVVKVMASLEEMKGNKLMLLVLCIAQHAQECKFGVTFHR